MNTDEWFLQINPNGNGIGHPAAEFGYHYGISSYHMIDWAGTDIAANTWYFCVGIIQPGNVNTLALSVNNGMLGFNDFHFDLPAVGTTPVSIGADSMGTAATAFGGRIDTVGLFNGALSQSDINALWNGGAICRFNTIPAGPLSKLVSWYDLDGPFIDGTWDDSAGSGRNFTPHNGVTVAVGIT